MTVDTAQQPRRALSGSHGAAPRAVLWTMCAGYFLVLLDVTIVNVALPRIGAALDSSVGAACLYLVAAAAALAVIPGALTRRRSRTAA